MLRAIQTSFLLFTVLFFSACDPYFLKKLQNYSLASLPVLSDLGLSDSDPSFSLRDEQEIVDLFYDIRETRSCSRIQRYVENSRVVVFFEQYYALPKGYLFDAFRSGYNYTQANFAIGQDFTQQIGNSFVDVWLERNTLDAVYSVTDKIAYCYPYNYYYY